MVHSLWYYYGQSSIYFYLANNLFQLSYFIIFWSVVHALGHYWNLLNLSESWFLDEGLPKTLNDIGGVNPITIPGSNITYDLFTIQAGWTGVMIAILFFFMLTAAAEPIRRSFFELFLYTHKLFIFIYPLLYFHGSGEAIKMVANLDDHDPEICSRPENLENWGAPGSICALPIYKGK